MKYERRTSFRCATRENPGRARKAVHRAHEGAGSDLGGNRTDQGRRVLRGAPAVPDHQRDRDVARAPQPRDRRGGVADVPPLPRGRSRQPAGVRRPPALSGVYADVGHESARGTRQGRREGDRRPLRDHRWTHGEPGRRTLTTGLGDVALLHRPPAR